jgi:hypothetical protein
MGVFLNNTLSLSQLENAMFLGRLGEQTVLKSREAFGRIRFVRFDAADREIYYPKKSTRDRGARSSYRKERGSIRASDAVYLVDILRCRQKRGILGGLEPGLLSVVCGAALCRYAG